jgi:hypothetical protein
MEEIGAIIGKGFGTWRNNLNLCIPFLLSTALSFLAMMPILAALAVAIGPMQSLNLTSLENGQILLAEMAGSLPSLIAAAALSFLMLSLFSAFFTAGAIGMVREALETGKATTDAMWSSGKKYFARMFLVSIMMGLAVVIGIVFLLPGIALLPSPLQPEPQAVGLLAIGAILFILYALIISLVLAVAPYALVVDSVGAVKAILASIDFFKYNKFDIFVLWLVVVALSLGMQMIGSLWVGENAGFQPLSMIVGLVNVLVLAPLSAVWWTRLYMVRKGMLKGDEVLDPW